MLGFTGDQVEEVGTVKLNVKLGMYLDVLKTTMEFVVVNISCIHNPILGRPGITKRVS